MISSNLFSHKNQFEVAINNALSEYQDFTLNLCTNEEYNQVIFKSIVALQIQVTRIEVRSLYKDNPFLENLFSGLLEAFHQFSMGYIKNVVFILRSSLEDFSKFLSLQITTKFDQNSFKKNKSKVEGYFDRNKESIPHYLKFNEAILKNYMMSLQNFYSVLSQTTHSLKLGISSISFLEDLVKISSDYLNPMYQYFSRFLNILHSIFIILSSDSFVNWDTYQLQNFLDTIFTKENRDIWIRRIKENSIEEPTLFCIEEVNDNLLTKNVVTSIG